MFRNVVTSFSSCISSRRRGKVRSAAPSTCMGFVMGHWPLAKRHGRLSNSDGSRWKLRSRDYEPLAASGRNYVRDRAINRAAAPKFEARRMPHRAAPRQTSAQVLRH